MQTDFDKLMDILRIEEKDRQPLFNNIICGNVELVLFYEDDGSISWGTLGDDQDDDVNETDFDPHAGCYTDDC